MRRRDAILALFVLPLLASATPRLATAQLLIPLEVHFNILADPYALDYEYTESMLTIESVGPSVVAEIVKRLPTDHVETKLRLIEILGRLGPAAATAMTELSGLVHDDNPFIRTAAIRALGCVGPAASRLQLELLRLLDDEDEVTRGQAAIATLQIDPSYFAYRMNELLIAQGLEERDVIRTRVHLLLKHVAKQEPRDPDQLHALKQLWTIARYNGLLDHRIPFVLNVNVGAPRGAPQPGLPQPGGPQPGPGLPLPGPIQPAPVSEPPRQDTIEDLFGE